MEIIMKICSKCKVEKIESDFYNSKQYKDGLRCQCKTCDNLNNKASYLKNRDKYIEKRSEEYSLNKDIINEKRRIDYSNLKNDQERFEARKLRIKSHYTKKRNHYLSMGKIYRQTLHGKYIQYRNVAKKRSINFKLSEEEFSNFWNCKCTYCDDLINTIGLDRIDSSKGYQIDNVVSCCRICNVMKSDLSKDDFMNQINKIVAVNNRNLCGCD